jgi:hypothetical protein
LFLLITGIKTIMLLIIFLGLFAKLSAAEILGLNPTGGMDIYLL